MPGSPMLEPTARRGARFGRVTSFDAHRGLGEVTEDSGTVFSFHSTAISDGSRDIAVGTRVSFSVTAGHGGRLEASVLGPVPAPPS
jgi:cold shock CspA family protein